MKDSPPEDLVTKIKDTFQGEATLHHSLARKVLNYFSTAQGAQLLTPAESEVLKMLNEGLPAVEAAQKVNISETELRRHLFQIFLKLHQLSPR